MTSLEDLQQRLIDLAMRDVTVLAMVSRIDRGADPVEAVTEALQALVSENQRLAKALTEELLKPRPIVVCLGHAPVLRPGKGG